MADILPYDPVPWLLAQDGLPALRARRLLGLARDGDDKAVRDTARGLRKAQLRDGSFEHSPMKTAGVLSVCSDLGLTDQSPLVRNAASYLLRVLESQPGYDRARKVKPGRLTTACDLCGFFGPYDARNDANVMADGAREMNFFREYEPLLGPKGPVRGKRRSSLDRPGPGSCYAWGLIPLAYTIEQLCRAGHGEDRRLEPAVNALLGAQRASGGWCRSLGGHPSCTLHVIGALGAHPKLRQGAHGRRALELLLRAPKLPNVFAVLKAVARFGSATARQLLQRGLERVAPRQKPNGTFGMPCQVERVAAVLLAAQRLKGR